MHQIAPTCHKNIRMTTNSNPHVTFQGWDRMLLIFKQQAWISRSFSSKMSWVMCDSITVSSSVGHPKFISEQFKLKFRLWIDAFFHVSCNFRAYMPSINRVYTLYNIIMIFTESTYCLIAPVLSQTFLPTAPRNEDTQSWFNNRSTETFA